MRIKFSPEAESAFQAVQADALKVNPFIESDNSRWIGAIVLLFQKAMTSRMRDELIQAVSTPESVRRALIQQVEQVSQGMDAQAIRTLEANIRKLHSQTKKSEVHTNEQS